MERRTLYRATAMVASAGAAIAARNLVTGAWQRRMGQAPPANPESPDTDWGEAIVWTMLTGALVGLARLLARRGAAAALVRVSGEHVDDELEAAVPA